MTGSIVKPREHPMAGTFVIVFAAIAGFWMFDTFLERADRSETLAAARQSFQQGQALAASGKSAEAVERFRDALASARGNRDYQLSLANALLGAGKTAEAETITSEALGHDSTDGPANLTMARIKVREGALDDAGSYYHRAIYGRWPADPARHRTDARLELIGRLSMQVMARQNAKQELLAELLAVEDDVTDTDTQKRLARLYLVAGSSAHSAQLFQAIIHKRRSDGDAYAGLAEAELAQRNYRQARADFETALRFDRNDAALRKRLDLTEEVLGLDPMTRGLRAAERYRRSALLLKLSNDALAGCAGASPSPEIAELLGRSATALKIRVQPSGEGDAMEANMDLALELWKARGRVCGPIPESEEPLALVLAEINGS